MKRLLTGFTMVLIAMVTLMPLAKAQKVPFIGTVVYDVTVAGNVPEQAKSMMPTEMTMKVSPDKLITVIHSSMMDIKNIFDAPAQVSNMLMDMMGQKLNIKNSVADLNEQKKKLGLTMMFSLTIILMFQNSILGTHFLKSMVWPWNSLWPRVHLH